MFSFESLSISWNMFKQGFGAFFKYPKLIVPIIAVWAVFCGIILLIFNNFNIEFYSFGFKFIFFFSLIYVFSILICFSASMMLEMIEDIETGRNPRLFKALYNTFVRNGFKILPIALIWAVIWLILGIVYLTNGNRQQYSEPGAFLGYNSAVGFNVGAGEFVSFNDMVSIVLRKGSRILVFMILPAIAWEELGPTDSFKRAANILKTHFREFISGFALTFVMVALIIAVPAFIYVFQSMVFGLANKKALLIWALIYGGLAWSLSIYVEQMFTALLFLWHKKWESEVEYAQMNGTAVSSFDRITQPSLIDNIPDLIPRRYRHM